MRREPRGGQEVEWPMWVVMVVTAAIIVIADATGRSLTPALVIGAGAAGFLVALLALGVAVLGQRRGRKANDESPRTHRPTALSRSLRDLERHQRPQPAARK